MPSYLPISSRMMKGLANDESSYSVRETGIAICIITAISIKGRGISSCNLYYLAPSPKFNIQHSTQTIFQYENFTRYSLRPFGRCLIRSWQDHRTAPKWHLRRCWGYSSLLRCRRSRCCRSWLLSTWVFLLSNIFLGNDKFTFSSSSDYPNGRSWLCCDLCGWRKDWHVLSASYCRTPPSYYLRLSSSD